MSSMAGNVVGATRSVLVNKATEIAREYYGTKCVWVELSNESMFDEASAYNKAVVFRNYAADFVAEIHHPLQSSSCGPDTCRICGDKSWPHDPLPQRERNEETR